MKIRGDTKHMWSLENLYDEQNLIKLACDAVPSFDGKNCESWADLAQKIKSSCGSAEVNFDWPTEPIVIKDQQLIHVNESFRRNFAAAATSASNLLTCIRTKKLKMKSRVYQEIKSDVLFAKSSRAWSLDLGSLVDYQLPSCVVLNKLDAIASFGPWFTSGHIETGGDDSITHGPVGNKNMLIATRGCASRRLESLITSVKSDKSTIKTSICYHEA